MLFPGKKVCVLGLGVSGFQSALFLKSRGYTVSVSDAGSSSGMKDRMAELSKQGIRTQWEKHTPDFFLDCDWVLISPGIPPQSPVCEAILRQGIPVYSEIETAYRFSPTQHIIAVTGTCGKTTVTTLIYRLLQSAGLKAVCCGNIGNPWIGELEGMDPETYVVLELSSFQLEYCRTFRPEMAILLNISPNHEDWHPDFQAYREAKLKIFACQGPQDKAVFFEKDQREHFAGFDFKATPHTLKQDHSRNPNEQIIDAVAACLNIPQENVNRVFSDFKGIEHRLECFLEAGGVFYVNDSKSTTPASLAWALDKYSPKTVHLIAGGHPKSDDFDKLRQQIAQKVKHLYLIGEAREKMQQAWDGTAPMDLCDDFESAVIKARQHASAGDTVLLSPACASFDMFDNYIHRGQEFKRIVKDRVSCQK